MNIEEKLESSFREIVSELPNYKDKIFIVEPFNPEEMRLYIVYDSYIFETKTVYETTKGLYIKGRVNSDEGRIYLNEFINKDGSNYEVKYNKSYKPKKEKFVSQRDIKGGSMCSKYGYSYFIYLGRVKNKKTNEVKYGYYSYNKEQFDYQINSRNFNIRYIDDYKSKLRFKSKVRELEDYEMNILKRYLPKDKFEYLDIDMNSNSGFCNHERVHTFDFSDVRYCKDCGKRI